MSPVQIHTLRACSLLVIPPSTERVPPPGGFPMDLSDLNLLGWAALVQDIAVGLQVLPPNLGHDMSLPAVALLQLLETTTVLGFCHYCCHLGSCMGAYQPAPPKSWSQIVEQTPGYGVTASSGGMTTPSTTAAGMSGYVAPPPGFTPIDFSSWRLPPPETPPIQRTTHHLTRPTWCQGGSLMLRGTAERNARAQMPQGPRGLAQQTLTQPMSAPRTPQMAPPLCQPLPGRPATPYRQAVQPPGKSMGIGVTSNSCADKAAPAGSQGSQDRGRQMTRERRDGGQPVSRPRGASGKGHRQAPCQEGDPPSKATQNIPPTVTPEGTPPQLGSSSRTLPCDPTQLAAKFCSTGLKKDLEHVLRVYYKFNTAYFREADWVRLRDTFFSYFLQYKEEALDIKEKNPMDFMPYIKDHFWRATGLCLDGL